ncbi:MAG: helix-turn-helix transcriptional regulator [Candidatus Omnitrophica bacterium]|nr:helix-turn-helix transcriptional regulator [Candidatus Omnitrophota bacterium]
MKIGKKLKVLRKAQKVTLNELSKKSGVQVATLSRMENDIMIGTLESHIAICRGLGISLSTFYKEIEEDTKKVHVSKLKERPESFVHSKKSTTEILVGKPMEKKFMPLLIKIKKSGQTHKEENKPGTEKFIYVTEGNITAKVGKEEYKLSKGDSIYFDCSLTHIFFNRGNSEACVLCIITPPML